MYGNKLTLNLRKSVKREPYKRIIHIKTEKKDEIFQQRKKQPEQSLFLPHRNEHPRKQASALDRNSRKKYSYNRNEIISASNHQEKQKRFPDIFNPSNTSAKLFSPKKKADSKLSMESNTMPFEKRKVESELVTERIINRRSENKSSEHHSIQSRLMTPIKEMKKEKKIQLFKAIRSEFHELINRTNNLSVRNCNTNFRMFVERGNNGLLVKEIMQKRWWWHVTEDKDNANLIWTEWIDKSVISTLSNNTLSDEIDKIQEYQIRRLDSSNKCEAVKMLVDDLTFKLIENKMSFNTNTYFRTHKNLFGISESLKNIREPEIKMMETSPQQVIHNHVDGCLNLHSKKLLFMNFHKFMVNKQWDPFKFLPLTFYISSKESSSIRELLQKFDYFNQKKNECKNIWIVKPGENSNRGNGIKVVQSKEDIMKQINSRLPDFNSENRSVIIQKYIEKCFLIHNRKFDIRCYILLTTVNGILKGYWYKDGYIRTSSIEYSLDDIQNQLIHLTNDAVQKKGDEFGKHEDSNKLSFEYFRQYLRKIGNNPYKFDEAYQQMKLIAYYLIASVSQKIKRKQFTFELFGLDFMLDAELNPILIEANSNPCLSNHGKILGKLIHELVENVVMTAIDPICPPPSDWQKKSEYLNKDYFSTNKFQLIFDTKANSSVESNRPIVLNFN